jgi:ribosomal protein S18 acetylase RimI-like enzyme
MQPSPLTVRPARFPDELAIARHLLTAYSQTPGVTECVAGFDAELAALPGRYAEAEGGALLLAFLHGEAVGCGAYRRLPQGSCEMKRLFSRPEWRGCGAGRALAVALMEAARAAGYRRMRLETLPAMHAAIGLYRSLGFREIERYEEATPGHALFFEVAL